MGLFNKKKNKVDTQITIGEESINTETTNTDVDTNNMLDDSELNINNESVVLTKDTVENNMEDTVESEPRAEAVEKVVETNKKGKKNPAEPPKEKEYILYIITDRKNPHMLEYMRQLDVNVTRIFTNISDAKDTLLMQVNPAKIVIIDTGTGRFSTINQRKEIIDLMGIADDEAMISVYQTDSVIRSEIKYNDAFDSKDIHWHKYKSTADVVAHLLNNKGREKYIFDTDDKEEIQVMADNVLDFKGLTFTEPNHLDVNMGSAALKLSDILNHMSFNEDKTSELESYVPRY